MPLDVFVAEKGLMVLVHGFVKKSRKTPHRELEIARRRATSGDVGSDFDTFLEEKGLLEESEAVATKRVLEFQIGQAMAEQKLSKAAMARRMKTSRSG